MPRNVIKPIRVHALPSTRDLTVTPAQDDTAGVVQSVLLLQDQQ
jgi:hypothetical protein